MTKIVQPPYPVFLDTNGDALEGGKIYVGEVGLDPEANPVETYLDDGLTTPIAQPLRTIGGIVVHNGSQVKVRTPEQYSIKITDANDQLIYTSLEEIADIDQLAVVRHDTAQSLTEPAKEQARTNIGSASAADVTNLETGQNSADAAIAGLSASVETLQGLSLVAANIKQEVVAAATGNRALSGLADVDSHAIAEGDRIILPLQTDPSENGIYTASAGAWVRTADANTAETLSGAEALVENGAQNSGVVYVAQSASTITLETDPVPFFKRASASAALVAVETALAASASQVSANALMVAAFNELPPATSTYYVKPDGDDSADGLTIETAWATITHAVHHAGEVGNADIAVVGGNYFEEGATAERWNLNGYEINVYAYGKVHIRMSESLAWTAHAWLFSGTAGTLRFYGGMGKRQFFFDGGFRGTAGTPNTTRAFFGCNNQAHIIEFHDIIYDANGESARLIGSSGIVGAVRFWRSELKNIGTYIGYVRGGFLELYSCYLTNITNTKICFGNMTEHKMISCTLDGCSINRNSTETYGKITLINNNAIARTTVAPLSPIPFASFTSGAVADFDIQANNTVRRDYISPATAADYVGIKINNADFIDASYRFKPLINDDGVPFAGPGLLAARGVVVAGHEYDLNGDKFGDNPSIGCFSSHVSTPQKYIPIAGSVAIIGDSFVHGASDRNSLSHVTEAAFPSLNFAKMPGSGFGQTTFYQNHVSIYGGIWSGIHYMALETAATRRCEALIVMGGVNDLNGGADRDDLVAAIIITLDTLNSIGCKVGYAGTQAQSATLGAEVFADSIYVEDQVEAHCIANGYECIKSTSLLTAISGWNADDATGYIDDDDLHPSGVGDAWYASDIMIPLTRSLLIT